MEIKRHESMKMNIGRENKIMKQQKKKKENRI
jgi:hypothetical protein